MGAGLAHPSDGLLPAVGKMEVPTDTFAGGRGGDGHDVVDGGLQIGTEEASRIPDRDDVILDAMFPAMLRARKEDDQETQDAVHDPGDHKDDDPDGDGSITEKPKCRK